MKLSTTKLTELKKHAKVLGEEYTKNLEKLKKIKTFNKEHDILEARCDSLLGSYELTVNILKTNGVKL